MNVSEIHRMAALDDTALCAAMWRAHGLGLERVDGCVACLGTRPRFYPNVVTVDPKADPQDSDALDRQTDRACFWGPSSSRNARAGQPRLRAPVRCSLDL
jgi:hypothetical protein